MAGQKSMPARPASYLSCASLARELEVSESHVRDMVRRGLLPPPRKISAGVWRWCWSEVHAFLGGKASAHAAAAEDPYMRGALDATKG